MAGHVAEAWNYRSGDPLRDLLEVQLGEYGVQAIGLYGLDGRAIVRLGDEGSIGQLPESADVRTEAVRPVVTAHGRGIAVFVPAPRGAIVTVLRTDDDASRVAPLIRLLGLYMGLIALALLLLASFALTRLIVRPLGDMSRGAERVAAGARRFDVPQRGARELIQLGVSLRQMTDRLMSEEMALRKKIEEVEHATARLKEAQDRLVRSERLASVGRLAAGLAHEVGNPIAAMIGLLELLIEGGLEEDEQRDFLERMRKETERINGILRDLLQFARPAAGAAPGADGVPGNVEVAVYDTVTLVSPQRSMKDIELAVDVRPDLPLVPLSREQLVQVLLNLVLNAGDACGGKGTVRVEAFPHEGGARISVSDTGPGIAAEVSETLFEPFVTTKDVGKGTGLGLSVCRGLVEAVGGTIQLDTAYGGGARFLIDLPAVEVE